MLILFARSLSLLWNWPTVKLFSHCDFVKIRYFIWTATVESVPFVDWLCDFVFGFSPIHHYINQHEKKKTLKADYSHKMPLIQAFPYGNFQEEAISLTHGAFIEHIN